MSFAVNLSPLGRPDTFTVGSESALAATDHLMYTPAITFVAHWGSGVSPLVPERSIPLTEATIDALSSSVVMNRASYATSASGIVKA